MANTKGKTTAKETNAVIDSVQDWIDRQNIDYLAHKSTAKKDVLAIKYCEDHELDPKDQDMDELNTVLQGLREKKIH